MITSYLLGYKLKQVEEVKYICGFPLRAINKIETEFERNKRKNSY